MSDVLLVEDDPANSSTPAGTTLAVGDYDWTYTTVTYSSNRTKRTFGSISSDIASATPRNSSCSIPMWRRNAAARSATPTWP